MKSNQGSGSTSQEKELYLFLALEFQYGPKLDLPEYGFLAKDVAFSLKDKHDGLGFCNVGLEFLVLGALLFEEVAEFLDVGRKDGITGLHFLGIGLEYANLVVEISVLGCERLIFCMDLKRSVFEFW